MNKIEAVINKIKNINLSQLIISCLLASAIVFSGVFDNSALAASNKSDTTYPTNDKAVEGLQYSNRDRVDSLDSVNDFVSPSQQSKLLDPAQIPAQKQPILDRSDPDAKLLEKTVQMFDEAGDFSAN